MEATVIETVPVRAYCCPGRNVAPPAETGLVAWRGRLRSCLQPAVPSEVIAVVRYLRRALALGPAGVADLILLSVLALVAEVGIRTRPLSQVSGWFRVRLTGEPTPPSSWRTDPKHRRRRRIVGMLTRHWPVADRSGLCLRRSLLLGWVFRDRDPLLRIGVARADGRISAHAWLEFDGRQIGQDGLHRPLSFDPPPSRHHDAVGDAER